ncbi:hypothetical protein HN014_22500 (plasmid) [Aquimarina sp. TRL1]|uniref:hypothetical protein n=1 Tax=Aquimarina sp. (strain TRL1) TaxID=2736252 RepID=UPI00158A672C|nr:hypothetical protein [Aquimarina sp. TRL1]QKX07773.1 hypothetical protein HN014_22500 [Aquimarina sp. TRL1]
MSIKNSGVIGLYTCSCHLFKNYDEAKKAKNQKLPIGTGVKNRCTGIIGIINEFCKQKGYVIVKYGKLPKDHHLEHVQELIKLENSDQLELF